MMSRRELVCLALQGLATYGTPLRSALGRRVLYVSRVVAYQPLLPRRRELR